MSLNYGKNCDKMCGCRRTTWIQKVDLNSILMI